MKITTGGAYVDRDGEFNRLPEQEKDVAESFFVDAAKEISAMPAQPTTICMSPEVYRMLKEASGI